eukprot:941954-Pyramimonas_sp.AAC.2
MPALGLAPVPGIYPWLRCDWLPEPTALVGATVVGGGTADERRCERGLPDAAHGAVARVGKPCHAHAGVPLRPGVRPARRGLRRGLRADSA